jgi:hypothetical protein
LAAVTATYTHPPYKTPERVTIIDLAKGLYVATQEVSRVFACSRHRKTNAREFAGKGAGTLYDNAVNAPTIALVNMSVPTNLRLIVQHSAGN